MLILQLPHAFKHEILQFYTKKIVIFTQNLHNNYKEMAH